MFVVDTIVDLVSTADERAASRCTKGLDLGYSMASTSGEGARNPCPPCDPCMMLKKYRKGQPHIASEHVQTIAALGIHIDAEDLGTHGGGARSVATPLSISTIVCRLSSVDYRSESMAFDNSIFVKLRHDATCPCWRSSGALRYDLLGKAEIPVQSSQHERSRLRSFLLCRKLGALGRKYERAKDVDKYSNWYTTRFVKAPHKRTGITKRDSSIQPRGNPGSFVWACSERVRQEEISMYLLQALQPVHHRFS